jgi:DNA modification methylase
MGSFCSYRGDWAKECLRILKPGGHLVAFGATRAIHRMVCALEDEGFEIRDMINWLYFSGFPKSMDISKQIDKMKGVEREVVGDVKGNKNRGKHNCMQGGDFGTFYFETKPTTEEAQYWSGWGTALKPAQEPAILCRKPIEKGLNVSENVLKWGTGAINIDACRFGYGDPCWVGSQEPVEMQTIC